MKPHGRLLSAQLRHQRLDLVSLRLSDLAEKPHGHMPLRPLDPFHIRAKLGKVALELLERMLNVFGQFDRDERAHPAGRRVR